MLLHFDLWMYESSPFKNGLKINHIWLFSGGRTVMNFCTWTVEDPFPHLDRTCSCPILKTLINQWEGRAGEKSKYTTSADRHSMSDRWMTNVDENAPSGKTIQKMTLVSKIQPVTFCPLHLSNTRRYSMMLRWMFAEISSISNPFCLPTNPKVDLEIEYKFCVWLFAFTWNDWNWEYLQTGRVHIVYSSYINKCRMSASCSGLNPGNVRRVSKCFHSLQVCRTQFRSFLYSILSNEAGSLHMWPHRLLLGR